jgi:phosphoribosylamine--glycine ligase
MSPTPTVLVLGSGAREHALVDALSRSPSHPRVIAAPGNDGMGGVERALVSALDVDRVVALARERGADLVVVGPEAPLVAGLGDGLRRAGIAVFGPSAGAARLEGSKAFAKALMAEAGVPTARWVATSDPVEAGAFAAELGGRVAVKLDGLAGGKGVIVCGGPAEAEAAIERLGAQGPLVVEERLEGDELSVIAVTDGRALVTLAPAQDHKRLGDGDVGPNTGGMGAYAPAPEAEGLLDEVEARCLQPILDVLAARELPYRGALYAGLMLTSDGPKVLEYNVRFGDPETQAILPLLDEDLYALLHAAATGTLEPHRARLRPGAAVAVVLASAGYPEAPRTGDGIEGFDVLPRDEARRVYAAGLRRERGKLVTAGGRVITMTGLGPDLVSAARNAYEGALSVCWDGMQYRRDIGFRALNRTIG